MEQHTHQHTHQPRILDNGIAFTVRVDSIDHECVISNDALAKLSEMQSAVHNPLETYCAFEAKINGVARRLVAANVKGNPLQLGPNSFH